MKSAIQKFIPAWILGIYHKALAYAGMLLYGNPSEKLVIIGITGTNGKSTTANLTACILEQAGLTVGLTSTVNFRIAGKEMLNDTKMTMPGRFFLQRMLRQMVDAGCQYAVIESSSEGILQHRHLGIHYDVMVFTNLTPEHLERHGGFENYKRSKLEYFKQLARKPHKYIAGAKIPKTFIANGNDEYAQAFLDFPSDQKIIFGIDSLKYGGKEEAVVARNVNLTPKGTSFSVKDTQFTMHLPGRFNVENALAAIATSGSQGISLSVCRQALASIPFVPGRMERIDEGQNFSVLVDYAPEPFALKAAYETIALWPKSRLIHVLGSAGGGRDRKRRKILGEMAGTSADVVIVTNEDPYDEDPSAIIDEVAAAAAACGKREGQNLFKITDRREAIKKALSIARSGDMVLLTGKGSEQAIVVAAGMKIPWDERIVARQELTRLLKKTI